MQVKDAIQDYLFASEKHSKKTQGWYEQKLKVFGEWCEQEKLPLENIRVADIRRFIQHIRTHVNPHTKQPISTYTVRGYAEVVKGFLSFCSKEDGLEEYVKPGLPSKIEMPSVDIKVIETFTPAQIRALLKACEKEMNESLVMRDRAIISVLLDTGIRASELIGLKLDQVHLEARDAYIKVYGKGRKEREVGLGKESRLALQKYITRFRKRTEQPYVFISRYGTPLTLSGLDRLFKRLGEWADIQGVRCSPHTMRHSYSENFLKQGGDIYKLSRLLGHTSVSVTETYLRATKQRDARNGPSVLDSL